MPVDLKVPEAGESITEVQIGQWHKREGDTVQRDEIVVEIETDKASMEVPAPVAGRISELLKQEGEFANVGDVLCRIETDGEPARSSDAVEDTRDDEPERDEAAEKAERAPEKEEAEAEKRKAASRKEADQDTREKKAAETAEDEREPPTDAPPSDDENLRAARGAALPDEAQPQTGAGLAMPAAMRLLDEHGLGLDDVEGTGPGGRVLKEDVLRHLDERGKDEQRTQGQAEGRRTRPKAASADREEEVVPMSMLRRRVAERLVKAQQTAALLTTFNEIDMSAVQALRDEYGETFEKKYEVRLGFMSFFVKAVIDALKQFPGLNAEVRDKNVVYRNYYDVGVAVSSPKGLVVPVVRDADRLSFADLELTIRDLAVRARDNKLEWEELEGGTFTISNGGVFGSMLSTPIVNPPQSGILGLHAIQDRPVARDGQVVIRPMMYVALTYDHRIVDGREAVTFLRRVKECIETPTRMLIEI